MSPALVSVGLAAALEEFREQCSDLAVLDGVGFTVAIGDADAVAAGPVEVCAACPTDVDGAGAFAADVWRVLSVASFEAEQADARAQVFRASGQLADFDRGTLQFAVARRWSQVAAAIADGLFERMDAEESEEEWRQAGMDACWEPDPDYGRDLDYDDDQEAEDHYDDAGFEDDFADVGDEFEGEH